MVKLKKIALYSILGIGTALAVYHFYPNGSDKEEQAQETARAGAKEPYEPHPKPKEKVNDVMADFDKGKDEAKEIVRAGAKKVNDVLDDVMKPEGPSAKERDSLEGIVIEDKKRKDVLDDVLRREKPAPYVPVAEKDKQEKAPAPYAPQVPEAEAQPRQETRREAIALPPLPREAIALPPLPKYCKLIIDEMAVADVRLVPEDSLFRVVYVADTAELHPQLFMARDASSYMFEGKSITQHEFVKRVAQLQKEGEKYIRRK